MDDALKKSDSLMTSINNVMDKLNNQNVSLALATDFIPGDVLNRLNKESYFAGMIVAPNADSKNAILGIPYQLINSTGKASSEIASWMATQVRKILRTDLGIGIVKNPKDRTFWIALVSSNDEEPQTIPVPLKNKRQIEDVIQKAFQMIAIKLNL
ncbi:CinA family protein [Ligilactobacillus cholophilus]|uniref:CinA family protein n=1 Tax=Ligilactobacillus cholophilus TaxID=3050131 RepID=UPI0025AFB4CC|nr:CinA family protein [Ligilactobacillus cholophilus]